MVGTPIGNLEDVTLRALRCLREADVLACEDTRRTRKLLSAHGIAGGARLFSYHAHSPAARRDALLGRIEGGRKVALVSDAGLPGFSDPGMDLVRGALERSLRVEVVPGPSAAAAALVASGFLARRYSFAGFLPAAGRDRREELQALLASADPVVLYEAPHRVETLLAELADFAPRRRVCLARELTKRFEESWFGTPAELLLRARTQGVRGEVTVVVGPEQRPAPGAPRPPLPELVVEVERRVASGDRLRDAVREVAHLARIGRNELYRAVLSERAAR